MHKTASQDAVASLHDLSATDLIAGYKAGQFSPLEVMEDLLGHIAAWEPHIKALYLFDPDGARKAARASTDRWQKGEPTHTLDGVPVTIKDNVATRGQPVPLGAASVPQVPAAADAPTLDELLAKISAMALDLLPDNHPEVDPASLFLQITALREAEPAVV